MDISLSSIAIQPSTLRNPKNIHNSLLSIAFFYLLQQNCGNYGFRGNGEDYDFVQVNKPVVAAELAGRIGEGFSDVLCGNGNLCGRDTPGPGICCKFHF